MRTRFTFLMGQNQPRWDAASRSAIFFCGSLVLGLALVLMGQPIFGKDTVKEKGLWSLQPVVRPEIPQGAGAAAHPIDAFLSETCREKGLKPFGRSDKLTWLRRVTQDLTGLPPSLEEQDAFSADESAGAVEKVVERLLASEQHGVRYARHWLDVLRYADLDEYMPSEPGIHLWRDWVIAALNRDLPFDEFARAQICGNRAARRQTVSAAGHLTAVAPRPEDLFALGFLARGATTRANTDQQLAIAAVETISSAFLGMTVACAKCHDHFYDPIKQTDYYSMKALFDPLVLRPVELATAEQVFGRGRAVQEHESRLQAVVEAMRKFIEPYHSRLYEERLLMLPKEAQEAIRKPEKTRSAAEQKVAEDYHPILRIDPPKIKEIMPPEKVKEYENFLKQIESMKPPEPLPVFWSVEEDAKRAAETNYVLRTGDPTRPKLNQPVGPGFPFAPTKVDFREGRRETFVDWLTAAENPLFARVAVNRVWQWHFGTGLHKTAGDFGELGGTPVHPKLLDWLSAEFVAHQYSLKWLHKLIVTSEAYQRTSSGPAEQEAANRRLDPANQYFWKYPLRRLEAEPIRDAMLFAAGTLDMQVGGKSFSTAKTEPASLRRTAYMARGYRSSSDVMPDYLTTFDAEDGRATCPRRNQTVTAPQALFMMNSEWADGVSAQFAARLEKISAGDSSAVVTLGFRIAFGRPPTEGERKQALAHFSADPEGTKSLAWLLLNLDEFLYVR